MPRIVGCYRCGGTRPQPGSWTGFKARDASSVDTGWSLPNAGRPDNVAGTVDTRHYPYCDDGEFILHKPARLVVDGMSDRSSSFYDLMALRARSERSAQTRLRKT